MIENTPDAVLHFITRVIQLAEDNVRQGGGPFAALVVKDGHILAEGVNNVTAANDPTAHAEVVAIRNACQALNSFQLEGCIVYASCEPCPMCLGALYWARPDKVFFAAKSQQAATAGFDDSFIYRELCMNSAERTLKMEHIAHSGSSRPFETWLNTSDKTAY